MPAYNAERHIEGVLCRISHELWNIIKNLWIINDGSKDSTINVVNNLKIKNPKIQVINFMHNKGYGNAVKEGLLKCKQDNCDYAVCLHADGQYPPEVILEFVNNMMQKNIDILQGSRIASGTALSGGMPLYKFLAGKMLNILENFVFRLNLTDYHSGMLFYSKKALNILPFNKFSSSFDFDLEVIACARAKNLVIYELPIPTRYANEISYLNPLEYGFRILFVLLKYLLGKYKKI
jgi:glycosyltransferase involved in cell wall biosynthesis